MSTAYDALRIARSLLNDDLGHTWSDSVLFPKLQIAQQELTLHLRLNDIADVQETSSQITVPAGSKDLGMNQPSDLVSPSRLQEKDVGDLDSSFIDMYRARTVPLVDPIENLVYWTWQGEKILFVGATTDRVVLIYYEGSLSIPKLLSDPLGFISAELYDGPRCAALALASIGDSKASMLNSIAENNLDLILRFNVKEDQDLPVRRLPYRRGKRRRIY